MSTAVHRSPNKLWRYIIPYLPYAPYQWNWHVHNCRFLSFSIQWAKQEECCSSEWETSFICIESSFIYCGVKNTRSAVSVDTNYLYFASLTGKNLRVMIGEKLNKNSELWSLERKRLTLRRMECGWIYFWIDRHKMSGWSNNNRRTNWNSWTREKVRAAVVCKAGSTILTWLNVQYLKFINSDKHLPQSPLTDQFLRWRHFALVSIQLISPWPGWFLLGDALGYK
jgi:hypothetical protein